MAEQSVELDEARNLLWVEYGSVDHQEHWDRLVDLVIHFAKAEAIREAVEGMDEQTAWQLMGTLDRVNTVEGARAALLAALKKETTA